MVRPIRGVRRSSGGRLKEIVWGSAAKRMAVVAAAFIATMSAIVPIVQYIEGKRAQSRDAHLAQIRQSQHPSSGVWALQQLEQSAGALRAATANNRSAIRKFRFEFVKGGIQRDTEFNLEESSREVDRTFEAFLQAIVEADKYRGTLFDPEKLKACEDDLSRVMTKMVQTQIGAGDVSSLPRSPTREDARTFIAGFYERTEEAIAAYEEYADVAVRCYTFASRNK